MTAPAVERAAAPLRILMYSAYLPPEYSGAALQALTLAGELRRQGHHVEFVTNRWGDLPECDVIAGFAVRRVRPGRRRKHREFRLWFNLARYAWVRRKDFDVLHSHGAYLTNAFVAPLARALRLKSVVKASLASDDLQDLSKPFVGAFHRGMLRQADACVAISADLAQEFERGGVSQQRIHRLPNGVDTARFSPLPEEQAAALRASFGLPVGRPIVLYVGVIDHRKNIRWLAEQWVAHRGFGTGALLLAVGPQARDDAGGELRRHLADLARRSEGLFELREHSDEVLPYFQCADLFVLPSVKEGLPNVVLEAMSCGLPCVAARASGTRELVVDQQTGLTYAQGDVQGLAQALRGCIGPEGRAMGRRAREGAIQRYGIRSVADAYVQIYRTLT